MHLKGALHVHTTCSDGELSIEETIRAHEALGYDFLALTDHDSLMRPGRYDAVFRIKTDLIVFTGIELTVFEKGYCHVSRIPGHKEVLHVFNHPAQLDLPLAKTIERIQAVARMLPLDAVEITSNGFKTPEYDIPEITYPKVATDDSHSGLMIGRAWIEMDCRRDKEAIIQAVKRGDFWNCYRN
ncbi:MAG: PHP domain-containing protein [Pseudomonadota bacterium]